MKSELAPSVGRAPRELIFAWRRGDEALMRFWFALVLACCVFAGAWLTIRIRVPASVAPDRPQVESAQLILLNEHIHPSLRSLLSARNLPSLGGEEMLGDAPLVEDMLLLLALKEEGKEALDLYPAPAVNLARTWPEINAGEFALPGLPEVSEEEWPNIENTEPAEWILEFSGQDAVGEFFRGRQLSWSQQVPATRESLWAVVTDLDGSLAFSLAVGDFDPEAKGEIRRLLEIMVEEGEQPAEPLAGLLQLNFHKSEEE